MALIDRVMSKTKDDSGRLTVDDDFQPAVDAALERYSRDRPRTLVDDISGNGTGDLDLPAAWVPEVSWLLGVEYPVGEIPASRLSPEEWTLYAAPDSTRLRLRNLKPGIGEPVRLTFTVSRTEDRIMAGDMDAVAGLAASICCETLANLFAQTGDPTIAADSVNHRSKSSEFTARGKRLRQLYLDHMGIDDGSGSPASMVAAPPPRTGWGLTHRRT